MKRRLLFSTLFALGCGSDAAPTADTAVNSDDGVVASPRRVDDGTYVAVIAPGRTAAIVAQTGATVDRVFVRMGQEVKKGDPILKLDDRSAQDRLRSARAAAAAARAAGHKARLQAANAQREYALEKRLFRQGVSAKESVRGAQLTMKSARAANAEADAEVARAESEMKSFERLAADTTLRAPMDGVVSLLRAREGDLVGTGEAVARILAVGELKLRFAVPSRKANGLSAGVRVSFSLTEGELSRPVEAIVRHVAPELEPPLQLVVVEAEFDGDSRGLSGVRAGRVGRVRILEGKGS